MHFRGCGSRGEVDHSLRLSPEAQVDASFQAEDLGGDWYVYLRSIGWSDAQVCGRESRPEYTDETLMRCEGVVYSCFV